MEYKVTLLPDAADDLRDLDHAQQRQVLSGLKKLKTEPEKRGLPLGSRNGSNLTGFLKLVVGKKEIRIVYRVEHSAVVVVWVIAARADKKCYTLAQARVNTYPDREVAAQLASVLSTAWGPQPG